MSVKEYTTGELINDFEMHYTTSFLHASSTRFEVSFESSDVQLIGERIAQLKEKLELGLNNGRHVGFQITIGHVLHLQELLDEILRRYKAIFESLPRDRKLNEVMKNLRAEYQQRKLQENKNDEKLPDLGTISEKKPKKSMDELANEMLDEWIRDAQKNKK